jgi:integrase
MRATYITLARQAGADLADVQYSVGHSDPKTTLRYDRSKGALDRAPVYQLPLRERGLRTESLP